jgi:adenylosuccinate lyase
MVSGLVGGQWNEGDVSCSVVRRVALPDACLALDGLYQTFLSVLDGFGAFPAVAERELAQYLPFVATTRMLIAAVKAGAGRETAHELIKEHAIAAALELREAPTVTRSLVERLAADERFPLDHDALLALFGEPLELAGRAMDQTAAVVQRIEHLCARYPAAAAYRADDIY